jgi:hypothetical protein
MPSAVKYWNGSSWESPAYFGKLRMWDGSEWRVVEATVATAAGAFTVPVTFSPAGGSSGAPTPLFAFGDEFSDAQVTIYASASVTWNWTEVGQGTASIANGGSGSNITFNLTAGLNDRTSIFDVSVGGTDYWTVELYTDGTGGGFVDER